jgi:hypothetical protein
MLRRAARTDANKAAIVSALRAMGCSVYDLRMPVDLLVGRNGKTLLMEIKDGAKKPSARKYTPAQEAFMSTWKGGAVATVTDVEGAMAAARVLG